MYKDELAASAGKTTRLTREFNRLEGLGEATNTLAKAFFKATEEGAAMLRQELDVMLKKIQKSDGGELPGPGRVFQVAD